MTHCILIGAPVDEGQRYPGCVMGPAAYRVAGLARTLEDLGHTVEDRGDVQPAPLRPQPHANAAIHHLPEIVAWTEALSAAATVAMADGGMPIFLGGDHALSLGTVQGVTAQALALGRPQFVIWLDAHSDFHTFETTRSGNLHGTPLAYAAGRPGFAPLDPFPEAIPGENICMFGVRSVDPAESSALARTDIIVNDMRVLDEQGIAAPLRAFLDRVEARNGLLHVSLDVDFLDPSLAPAVGTTVPGGATFREAHLVMELLHESGRVTSLDLVELNPFLDERGRTARLMVDLVGSLMGRKVFDRPTRSY